MKPQASKWTSLIRPGVGGTFTVYDSLRKGLATHGIELPMLALNDAGAGGGPSELSAMTDAAIAGLMTDAVVAGGYEGVFVNVHCDHLEMNLSRYLPAQIKRIMIVHSITPQTYASAQALHPYVHRVVGVSPRIRDDLIRKGVPADRTTFIANGIDTSQYPARVAGSPRTLRLGSLGRIEETAKGVFWLCGIMRHLADLDVRLTVAGDGPDLVELKRRCEPLGGRVVFAGRVPLQEVPRFFLEQDVLLMPSRFEGLPCTTIEAMAAGCVPVMSRIRGVSDFVVEEGKTGLLFAIGNCRQAADAVRKLHEDRQLLAKMSAAAAEAARRRFDIQAMGDAYAELIGALRDETPEIAKPLSLQEWHYPRAFSPGIRKYVPGWMKNVIRKWRA